MEQKDLSFSLVPCKGEEISLIFRFQYEKKQLSSKTNEGGAQRIRQIKSYLYIRYSLIHSFVLSYMLDLSFSY